MGKKRGSRGWSECAKEEKEERGSTLCSVTDKRWRVTKASVNTHGLPSGKNVKSSERQRERERERRKTGTNRENKRETDCEEWM